MMWKIDTTKTGVEAIMKPYQYGIITHILDREEGITSGEMHAHLEFMGYSISRASVINYVQLLAKEGIITQEKQTGKGGYRGVYSAKLNFKQILTGIVESVMDKVLEAFPDTDIIKHLPSASD